MSKLDIEEFNDRLATTFTVIDACYSKSESGKAEIKANYRGLVMVTFDDEIKYAGDDPKQAAKIFNNLVDS